MEAFHLITLLANIMNKEISTAIVHSYHKRAHVPLMQAKEILTKMENELFKRVLRAMNEQHDAKEPFFDPIESDPEVQEIIAQVKKEAEDLVKRRNGLRRGSCHLIWREAETILKEKHNISWYSPAKMNPLVCYD